MTGREGRRDVRSVLLGSLHGRGRELRRLLAWSLVEALPAFASGRLVANAIDDGFLAGSTTTGFAWLGVLGASVLVGAWATRRTLLCLAALVEPLRDELVTRVVEGAVRRSTVTGARADDAAVARLTEQVEIVRGAYASTLIAVQGFAVTAGSALAGLATLLPVVLVFVIPPLVIGLGLFLGALARIAAWQRVSILAAEDLAREAGALAVGFRDVTACGAEQTAAATVAGPVDASARATVKLARLTGVRTLAVAVGGWLPIVLILVAGSWLLDHGASTGVLLGALTYVARGVHPALESFVKAIGSSGLWLVVALRRIVETTEAPVDAAAGATPAATEPRGYEVRLRDATFGYGRAVAPVIDGLDLVIAEGDHLAVVGPSGVGKSTLAGLIAGLIEPQRGDALLGGVAIAELDPATAARHRALIPQQAYVFAGTLRENLAYLRPDTADAAIDGAAELLGARALVQRLGGLDAEFDPHALSAGERQLLTLVRAYLAPARLVILDEATCHLDPAAEAQVERAFSERDGSLIVIAHRISSALRAQRVLVLDGGPALAGTHEQLLARSALYRDLVGFWGTQPPRAAAPADEHQAAGVSALRGMLARIGRALGRRGFKAPA